MGREKPLQDDAVRDRIRGAGMRCTPARVAVMHHLETAPGPLTHAEVSEALHHLGFDRATIYRNLTELTEAGLASRVELGDHVWRFEMRHGGVAEHPHFLCTSCGEVSCLDDVDVAITPKPGARPAGRSVKKTDVTGSRRRGIRSVSEVLLKGTCEQCD
jgi:Fur family ferric uptake transcriptional regulator